MFKNLLMLVLDEADRMMEVGFEEELRQILEILPKQRLTLLFSATQTTKVEDIARITWKNESAALQCAREPREPPAVPMLSILPRPRRLVWRRAHQPVARHPVQLRRR